MKRALIVSRNLIGDALNAGIAIREWFRLHRAEYDGVDLLTIKDHVTCLYSGLGVEWGQIWTDQLAPGEDHFVAQPGWEYDKVYSLGAGDAGKYADEFKVSIVEGFCYLLEIQPPVIGSLTNQYGTYKAWHPYYDPTVTLKPKGLHDMAKLGTAFHEMILFSPWSASCSSRKGGPPNKMLYPAFWKTILSYLRGFGKIKMLGAPGDEPDKSWQLSEDEVMTGIPLDELAWMMKYCKLVVTIDNGMGHLAASQDAKHILFYPMCLGLHFILPWGANNTVPIQIEPTQIQLALLMASIKRSVKHLGVE